MVLLTFLGHKLSRQFALANRLQSLLVRSIPFSEIKNATDNFSDENVLGEGGYGLVYKGRASNGELWAVKRSKRTTQKSLTEFETEVFPENLFENSSFLNQNPKIYPISPSFQVYMISQISHNNIVKLIGFCNERKEQILVYEFMQFGSLKRVLHGSGTFLLFLGVFMSFCWSHELIYPQIPQKSPL